MLPTQRAGCQGTEAEWDVALPGRGHQQVSQMSKVGSEHRCSVRWTSCGGRCAPMETDGVVTLRLGIPSTQLTNTLRRSPDHR